MASVAELKSLVPVAIKLPTKQHPHIMGLLDEIEYPCGNCTQAQGHPVYHTLRDSYLDPISGPGEYHTRLGVYCPDCKTQCRDFGYVQNGIVDLLQIPKTYKKAVRAAGPRGGGIYGDDADEADAPVLRLPEEKALPKPKRSPASPAAVAKKKRLKAGAKAAHAGV